MNVFVNASPAKLDRWLERDPDRFARYLAAHPEIADRYDDLTRLGNETKDALVAALDVPFDLAARLRTRLAASDDTSPTAVVFDLVGLGVATIRELADPPID